MSAPPLSVVMASHNDADQTVLTLKSIRETAPGDVEVVIVDDCSATPLHHYIKEDEYTKLVTNRYRCGCGPSRHIGALRAQSSRYFGGPCSWLLLCDSHMRFSPGWFQAWLKTVELPKLPVEQAFYGENYERIIFCATCLGLDSKHMDLNAPVAEYHGATMNLAGEDRFKKGVQQVFEAVWLPKEPELADGAEIPAVMGAAYFISRDWFLHLSCLRYLRFWGGDEQALSIGSWLAGGSVRLAKSVRIGHKFLIDKKEVQAWGVPPGYVIWSKLHVINAMLPPELANKLSKLLLSGKDTHDIEAAKRLYKDDYHITACERARYQQIFTVNFEDYCAKFGIPIP